MIHQIFLNILYSYFSYKSICHLQTIPYLVGSYRTNSFKLGGAVGIEMKRGSPFCTLKDTTASALVGMKERVISF